jgi:hypothetical protein
MLVATGCAMTLGPEAAAEVADWLRRVGWPLRDAPVRLEPVAP